MNKIIVLKKRKDFLRAAKGVRMVVSTAILQAARSLSEESVPFKVGFTASKKIGKAYIRSRAKRRLRAVVREVFPELALPNTEYVLISRFNTAYCPYEDLKSDIKRALKKLTSFCRTKARRQKIPSPKNKQKGLFYEKPVNFVC